MAHEPKYKARASWQLRRNYRQSIQQWRIALLFALLWAVTLSAHSFANLYLHGWQDLGTISRFSLLMFIGAFFGSLLGWVASGIFAAHRPAPKRFATGFVFILIATVGVTAALFAMQYRMYYAQWHQPSFTITWFFQFAFTFASAVYLFAVQGLRTLLPLGPVALFIAALLFVRYGPSTDH